MEGIITDYSRNRSLEIQALSRWDPIRKDLNVDGEKWMLVYAKGNPFSIPEQRHQKKHAHSLG